MAEYVFVTIDKTKTRK